MKTLRGRITMFVSLGVIISIILVFVTSNVGIYYSVKEYIKEDKKEKIVQVMEYIKNIYRIEGGLSRGAVEKIRVSPLINEFDISIHDVNHNLVLATGKNDSMMGMNHMMPMMRSRGNYIASEYEIKDGGQTIAYIEIGYFESAIRGENHRALSQNINRSILYSAFVSLVIALLFGLMGSKVIYRPIRKLTKMATEIKNGNLDTDTSENTGIDEIDKLSIAMNSLLESLRKQNSLRKRLAMDMSHEIKTPLSVIYSQISGIRDGIYEATDSRLEIIEKQIDGLTEIIDRIKHLNEMESRALRLNIEETDLNLIIRQSCMEYGGSFESKGIELVFNNDEKAIVWADRKKMRQVFTNLLSNALKYTDQGLVEISTEDKGYEIKISVCDTGIGIDEKDIEFIFERLYRTDESRSKDSGGMGIGLSIVKSIIEEHGGQVSARSENGAGTCIDISLPVKISDIAKKR